MIGSLEHVSGANGWVLLVRPLYIPATSWPLCGVPCEVQPLGSIYIVVRGTARFDCIIEIHYRALEHPFYIFFKYMKASNQSRPTSQAYTPHMATRVSIAALLCSVAATATHIHHPSSTPPFPFGSLSATSPEMPSTDSLHVQLSAGSENSTVACTIRNTDSEHTISFLTWDTPFDPTAVNTGVLTLKDAETGADVPSPDMKLNRQMPPPRDALVEIAPESSAERELNLSSPWIPTDGRKYQVGVHGTWRAVWQKPAAQVTNEDLAALKGDQAMQGGFDSGSGVEMILG